jgi:hypothetical protein
MLAWVQCHTESDKAELLITADKSYGKIYRKESEHHLHVSRGMREE